MNSKEYVMPDGKKVVFEYDHDGIGKVTIEAMDMLMGLITDGRKRGEWIPCSERLPTEIEQDCELGVLVTLGNGYSGIQFDWVRDGEHWYDWDGYIIAWMPLPEPYCGADIRERKESE